MWRPGATDQGKPSGVPGRSPLQLSTTGAEAMGGHNSAASARSCSTASGSTRRSNPARSTVAPIAIKPSPRDQVDFRRAQNVGQVKRRRHRTASICPFRGSTPAAGGIPVRSASRLPPTPRNNSRKRLRSFFPAIFSPPRRCHGWLRRARSVTCCNAAPAAATAREEPRTDPACSGSPCSATKGTAVVPTRYPTFHLLPLMADTLWCVGVKLLPTQSSSGWPGCGWGRCGQTGAQPHQDIPGNAGCSAPRAVELRRMIGVFGRQHAGRGPRSLRHGSAPRRRGRCIRFAPIPVLW